MLLVGFPWSVFSKIEASPHDFRRIIWLSALVPVPAIGSLRPSQPAPHRTSRQASVDRVAYDSDVVEEAENFGHVFHRDGAAAEEREWAGRSVREWVEGEGVVK